MNRDAVKEELVDILHFFVACVSMPDLMLRRSIKRIWRKIGRISGVRRDCQTRRAMLLMNCAVE